MLSIGLKRVAAAGGGSEFAGMSFTDPEVLLASFDLLAELTRGPLALRAGTARHRKETDSLENQTSGTGPGSPEKLPPGPWRSLGGYLDYSNWEERDRFLELA